MSLYNVHYDMSTYFEVIRHVLLYIIKGSLVIHHLIATMKYMDFATYNFGWQNVGNYTMKYMDFSTYNFGWQNVGNYTTLTT